MRSGGRNTPAVKNNNFYYFFVKALQIGRGYDKINSGIKNDYYLIGG
ncbi:hypothetical protein [Caproicibacter fermentans]|nr:hypothetical protein [Caproicibacter fermentans]